MVDIWKQYGKQFRAVIDDGLVSMDRDVRWFKSMVKRRRGDVDESVAAFTDRYDELCDGISRSVFFTPDADHDKIWYVLGGSIVSVKAVYGMDPVFRDMIDHRVMRARWRVLAGVPSGQWNDDDTIAALTEASRSESVAAAVSVLRKLRLSNGRPGWKHDVSWSASWNAYDGCMTLVPRNEYDQRVLSAHDRAGCWNGPVPMDLIPMLSGFDRKPSDLFTMVRSARGAVHVESSPFRRNVGNLADSKNSRVTSKNRNMDAWLSPYWRYWTAGTTRLSYPGILVDVDRKDALEFVDGKIADDLAPKYSWAIVNHANGHAQFCWQVPPIFKSNAGAAKLYSAVYKTLSFILEGDACFTGLRSQNPLWIGLGSRKNRREIVIPDGVYRLYSLDDLKQWFKERRSWCPAGSMMSRAERKFMASTDPGQHGGVRPEIVEALGPHAREIIGGGLKSLNPGLVHGVTIPEGWRNNVAFRVATWLIWHGRDPEDVKDLVRFDDKTGDMDRECDAVIAKVRRFFRKTYDPGSVKASVEYREHCRKIGRKGGMAHSEKQQAAIRRNLADGQIMARSNAVKSDARIWRAALVRGGKSNRKIALELGVSAMTIKRALVRVGQRIRQMIEDRCSTEQVHGVPVKGCGSTRPLMDKTIIAGVDAIMAALRTGGGRLLDRRLEALGGDLVLAGLIDRGLVDDRAVKSYTRKINLVSSLGNGMLPVLNTHENDAISRWADSWKGERDGSVRRFPTVIPITIDDLERVEQMEDA
jgi:hypothetical protein